MAEIKKNEIKIISASGDAESTLVDCYYMPKPDGEFNFHYKDGKVKRRDIQLDQEFSFVLEEAPEKLWHLVLHHDPADPSVYWGNWRTGVVQGRSLEDGTYQAQAGGTFEEDAASAYA